MIIHLKASNGKYVTHAGASNQTPLKASAEKAGAKEKFLLRIIGSPRVKTGDFISLETFRLEGNGERTLIEKYIANREERWRVTHVLYAHDASVNREASQLRFKIHRLTNEKRIIKDGDRVAFSFDSLGFLSADSTGALSIINRSTPGEKETFTIETTQDLNLYWSADQQDNFSTTSLEGGQHAMGAGYQFVRNQGRVYMNPARDRRPLFLFWNAGNGDNLLVATEEGKREALSAGYVQARWEGYVLSKPEPGSIPLRTYWRGSERMDYFSTTSIEEERDAGDARYEYVRDEGYILPTRVSSSLTAAGLGSGLGSMLGSVVTSPSGAGGGPRQIPGIAANLHRIRLPEGLGDHIQLPQILDLIQIPSQNSPRRRRGSNKKALVLSGGGAKGSFEVGAVKYLWEKGYRPDIICGVSVGALNAAKLAECKDTSAAELEAIWRKLNPAVQGARVVYAKQYFQNLAIKWLGNMAPDILDDLADPTLDHEKLLETWVTYLTAHFHSIHSMHPLKELLQQNINLDAISQSGTQLRIGVTDLETGQFFSVTEPAGPTLGPLKHYGLIDVEPDHRLGDTWLNRPIFGANYYAMELKDAIIASSMLPVFMDPKVLNLRLARPAETSDGKRIAVLTNSRSSSYEGSTYRPPAIERIMKITRQGTRGLDGGVFAELKQSHSPQYNLASMEAEGYNTMSGDSLLAQHHLFDGGLRDTMAIRTAIRLGAREITVITGDRLHAAHWNYTNVKEFPLPAAQYLFGLLGLWFNEAARTDMLLGVAQNEFLGWMYRTYSLLDADKRKRLLREFNQYWSTQGAVLQEVLGGSTWIGGDVVQTYGTPFLDEGCAIKYIMPDTDIVEAIGFEDWDNMDEAINLGYEAAQNPVQLSQPVPNDLIE
jgi:predicted acylesterase/phospholipase RssA